MKATIRRAEAPPIPAVATIREATANGISSRLSPEVNHRLAAMWVVDSLVAVVGRRCRALSPGRRYRRPGLSLAVATMLAEAEAVPAEAAVAACRCHAASRVRVAGAAVVAAAAAVVVEAVVAAVTAAAAATAHPAPAPTEGLHITKAVGSISLL